MQVVHEPQSASASTTASHSAAILVRNFIGHCLLKVGFVYRFTFKTPLLFINSTRRSKYIEPPGLLISMNPTVSGREPGEPEEPFRSACAVGTISHTQYS